MTTKKKPDPKPAASPDKTTKASGPVADLAAQLVKLTVLEVNDLSNILADDYGIKPQAPVAVAAAASPDDQAGAADAKSDYNVVLKDPGGQKVAVIKAIKELTGLGLGEAKAIVDEAPKSIKESVNREEADAIKAKLEEVGASVELT